MTQRDHLRLGQPLHAYLTFRSARSGSGYALGAADYGAAIERGTYAFSGVQVNGVGDLLVDAEHPALLAEWRGVLNR